LLKSHNIYIFAAFGVGNMVILNHWSKQNPELRPVLHLQNILAYKLARYSSQFYKSVVLQSKIAYNLSMVMCLLLGRSVYVLDMEPGVIARIARKFITKLHTINPDLYKRGIEVRIHELDLIDSIINSKVCQRYVSESIGLSSKENLESFLKANKFKSIVLITKAGGNAKVPDSAFYQDILAKTLSCIDSCKITILGNALDNVRADHVHAGILDLKNLRDLFLDADLVIGPDCGLMHLAGYFNSNLVVRYGTTSVFKNAQLTSNRAFYLVSDECNPYLNWVCSDCESIKKCLNSDNYSVYELDQHVR
jgi:hypothetical protein